MEKQAVLEKVSGGEKSGMAGWKTEVHNWVGRQKCTIQKALISDFLKNLKITRANNILS